MTMKMPRPQLRAREGFTLVEMAISLALGSLIMAVFFGGIYTMQRSYGNQRDTRGAEEVLRTSEHMLRSMLQTAGADPLRTGSARIVADTLGTGSFNNLALRSDFNPPNGNFGDMLEGFVVRVRADSLQVKWSAGGGFETVAYPVSSILFEFFDQNGTALTTQAAVHASAKSVRFTVWAPERPGSTSMRSRRTWVFLQNRR